MTRLASTIKKTVHLPTGHTVFFPGNKEWFEVPDSLVPECLKHGAYMHPSDSLPDSMDAEAEASPATTSLSHEERKRRAVALIKEMVESPEKHRDHFTAAGRPSSRYVSNALGFKVMLQEIEDWWNDARG
jgi:hypothetical protein